MKEVKSESEFKELMSNTPKLVVDFWAPWCGPCLKMAPVFEKLSEKYSGITFIKINTDENDIASNFHIMGIPTFILFSRGKEIKRIIGANSSELEKSMLLLV